MKKNLITLLTIILSVCGSISGCPTCVGRVQEGSPPFFSEEFYSPSNERMDELYEQFVQQETLNKPSDSAYPGLPARQATPDKKEAS